MRQMPLWPLVLCSLDVSTFGAQGTMEKQLSPKFEIFEWDGVHGDNDMTHEAQVTN